MPSRKLNGWGLCMAAALGAQSALAQESVPQTSGNARALDAGTPADGGAATEAGQPVEGGETAPSTEGEVLAQPATPGIAVLARWIREAGCRVFIDFPVDENTRFSPSSREPRTGWRISVPRFAGAGAWIAGSGEFALDGAPGAAEGIGGEFAPGDAAGATAGGAEGGTAEGAVGADGIADPGGLAAGQPVARPLTWTQRVGLVKADAPAGGSAAPAMQTAGAASAQPTWTQRIGLVKGPSTADAASSGGVASFSGKKKTEPER